jgi:hypothetical protein
VVAAKFASKQPPSPPTQQQQQQPAPAAASFFPAPAFTMGASAPIGQSAAAAPRTSPLRTQTHKIRQQQQQQQPGPQAPQAPPQPSAAEVAMRSAEQWVERAKVSWEARRFEQSEREFTQVRQLEHILHVVHVCLGRQGSLSSCCCVLAATNAYAATCLVHTCA